MSVLLGALDLIVKADPQQIKSAYREAGQAAGNIAASAFGSKAGNEIGALVSRVLQAVGGGTAAAAGSIVSGVAGGGGGASAAGAAAAAGATGPVGIAIAAIAAAGIAIGGLVFAVKKATSAMLDEASRLSYVNGQLAGAEAAANVRQIMRDIASGGILGPSLSGLVNQVQNLKDAFAPLVNLIKLGLTNALRLFLSNVEIGAKLFNQVFRYILDGVEALMIGIGAMLSVLRNNIAGVPVIGGPVADGIDRTIAILGDMQRGIHGIQKSLDQQNDNMANQVWNTTLLRSMEALSGGRLNVSREFYGGGPMPGG